MFSRSAAIYDAVYSWKDYEGESSRLLEIIRERVADARTLLDVACGTGAHLRYVSNEMQCVGVDLDGELLKVARQRNPDVEFEQGDMTCFDLGRQFDVLTCLFSSIGYVETLDGLAQAAHTFFRHVKPGGLALIEPWFTPDKFEDGHLGMTTVNEPDLKVARMNTSRRDGILSVLHFEYLIATREGFERYAEEHSLGMFTEAEHFSAFEQAGFRVEFDSQGLMGRGLYALEKPAD